MSVSDAIETLRQHRFLRAQVQLEPLDGPTFQPATFANTGASFYEDPRGRLSCVVESVASMANLLEATIWDELVMHPDPAVAALPWVNVVTPDGDLYTTSRTAAHRLYAHMLVNGTVKGSTADGTKFESLLKGKLGSKPTPPLAPKLGAVAWELDPLSIVHGVWFSGQWSGRARLTRALAARIDAHDVQSQAVQVGGQKTADHVLEIGVKQTDKDGDTVAGEIPHFTSEVSAAEIVATVLLDVGLLRSYGLGEERERALLATALLQLRRLLDRWPRRRSRCVLAPKADGLTIIEPTGWTLPGESDLADVCASMCSAATGVAAAEPLVVEVTQKALAEAQNNKEDNETSG